MVNNTYTHNLDEIKFASIFISISIKHSKCEGPTKKRRKKEVKTIKIDRPTKEKR
jgi:hypothetical protein